MVNDDMYTSLLAAAAEQGLTFDDPAPPASRFVEVNGLKLHYLDWGIDGNPPMILIHGRAVTAHSWDFFSLAMRPQFHVYALDQRGHGDSDWAADGDYSRESHASDLVNFVNSQQLDSMVLVGHSLGGAVALLAAPQLAGRVRALVIVDSSLAPRQAPNALDRFVHGQDTFPSLEAFVAHAHSFNPRRDPRQLLGSLRHNTRQLPDGQWTWKYDKILRDPNRPQPAVDFDAIWDSLRNSSQPILVVRASERSHIGERVLPDLEALAPRVQVVEVPQAGHSVMGDNPRYFERVMREFFESIGLQRAETN